MSEERQTGLCPGLPALFTLLGSLCSRKRHTHTLDSGTAETAPIGGLGGPCPPPPELPSPDRRRAGHRDSSASAALLAGPDRGALTVARRVWHNVANWLTRTTPPKRYAAFVSHYKREAALDARYVQEKLLKKLRQPVFIDSDHLHNLTNLEKYVRQSDVLVLVQTKSVLRRPYCLVELITACKHYVPIVGVCVSNGLNPYNHVEAEASLSDLEETLEPEAKAQVKALLRGNENEIDDLDEASWMLSCIPKIISVPIDFSASKGVLDATIVDLKDKIDTARCNGPVKPPLTREEWERQKQQRRERSTAAAAAAAAAAPVAAVPATAATTPAAATAAAAAAAAPPPAAPLRRYHATPAEHSAPYRGSSHCLRQHVSLVPHSRRVVQSSEHPLARRPARAVVAEAAGQTLKISPRSVYLSG